MQNWKYLCNQSKMVLGVFTKKYKQKHLRRKYLKKNGDVEKRSDRILCIYYKSENRT